MALTLEELQQRAHYLGSSDIPALLGVSRYRNITDVFLEKRGRIELKQTSNPAADFGTRVEPVLVQMAADRAGEAVMFNQRRIHDEHKFMSAQLDGWLPSSQRTVESKSHGLFSPVWNSDGWGDGGDEIPFVTLAQVNYAMLVSGAESSIVVALLGRGMGVRFYDVPRVPALIEEIERRAISFWHDNVLADVMPEDVPHLDTLKLVLREPETAVEVSDAYPATWVSMTDQAALVAAARDDLKARILNDMGDCERGITPFGDFTYKANVRGVRTFRFTGGKE